MCNASKVTVTRNGYSNTVCKHKRIAFRTSTEKYARLRNRAGLQHAKYKIVNNSIVSQSCTERNTPSANCKAVETCIALHFTLPAVIALSLLQKVLEAASIIVQSSQGMHYANTHAYAHADTCTVTVSIVTSML